MILYDVYSGPDGGGPIDYTTPIATTSSLSLVVSGPTPGTSRRYGVRVRDSVTGLQEKNTDAQILVAASMSGTDATYVPFACQAVRGVPKPGGTVVIEWAWPYLDGRRLVKWFNIYLGRTGAVVFGRPAATVHYPALKAGVFHFRAVLPGLLDGIGYSVVVRAANAFGEEQNTTTANFTARSSGPAPIGSLTSSLSH